MEPKNRFIIYYLIFLFLIIISLFIYFKYDKRTIIVDNDCFINTAKTYCNSINMDYYTDNLIESEETFYCTSFNRVTGTVHHLYYFTYDEKIKCKGVD